MVSLPLPRHPGEGRDLVNGQRDEWRGCFQSVGQCCVSPCVEACLGPGRLRCARAPGWRGKRAHFSLSPSSSMGRGSGWGAASAWCGHTPWRFSRRGLMLACLRSHKRLPLTPTLSPYGAKTRLRGEGPSCARCALPRRRHPGEGRDPRKLLV